jgi:3-oxoacyl-[acyl-carrier protein] reductase
MEQLRTEQRVALVTGASRRGGIGAAICRRLAADGIAIGFTYWLAYDRTTTWGSDEDGPAALERELRSLGVPVAAIEADHALPATASTVLDEVTARLGQPATLVNNAAVSMLDGYEVLDAAMLDAHYAVNIRGMALLSVEFARRWPGGPGGRIINLTSGQSLGPMPGELAYIMTKGAVEAFTVSLSAGVAAKGITVNAVNPGPTDTGWMSPELAEILKNKFPAGRLGQPEDVARLVAFLASPDAEWITGQVIHSEGGFLRT